MTNASISLAAFRAIVETLIEYVPYAQRETALAAATAIGMGYAFERRRTGHEAETVSSGPCEICERVAS